MTNKIGMRGLQMLNSYVQQFMCLCIQAGQAADVVHIAAFDLQNRLTVATTYCSTLVAILWVHILCVYCMYRHDVPDQVA